MSMKRFGFTVPPVRNETTGKLVAGHGRIETLKVLEGEDITKPPANIKLDDEGNWLIPIIAGIHFESDDEAKAYLIASNRLTELGGWKNDELVDLLQEVAVNTEDLAGIGYQLEDIENLLTDLEEKIFVDEEIEDADETTVRFKFGRYKFGVDADYFYDWEAEKIKELGTNSPQALTDWIKQQLGL